MHALPALNWGFSSYHESLHVLDPMSILIDAAEHFNGANQNPLHRSIDGGDRLANKPVIGFS
jgi:hypothetical protein